MATYRLTIDVRPGGKASLDEFADETRSTWEQARALAREVEPEIRRRYPAANARVYATEWDGRSYGDPLRPRAIASRECASSAGSPENDSEE